MAERRKSGLKQCGLAIALISALLAARAEAANTRPFDFAQAERVADQQLKRQPEKPPPPEAKEKEPPPAVPLCKQCGNLYEIRCPQHKAQAPCLIEGQPEAQRCKLCLETGRMVCPACKTKKDLQPQWEIAEARQKSLVDTATLALKEIDGLEGPDLLGYKLTGYASPHFSIGTTLDRKLVLPCVLHGEGLIEKLNLDFRGEVFSFPTPTDTRFYMLDNPKEFETFLDKVWRQRFPDIDAAGAAKTMGQHTYMLPSTACNCFERMKRNPSGLQHTFVHFLGHFLLNRVSDVRSYPPWIEEGFAAYAESLEMSTPNTHCMQYAVNMVDVVKNRDSTLRKMATQNTVIPMPKLVRMTYIDMKAEEYFMSWSLMDMLVERDPTKFLNFLKAMPTGEQDPGGLRVDADDQEKALKEAYGYDYAKLIAVWRQWVLR